MVVEWTTMPKGLAAQVEKKATVTTSGGEGKQQGEGGGSGSGNGEDPAPKVKGRISLRKAVVLIKMARLSQKNRTSAELKKEIVRLKDLANQLTEEEEMMLAEAAAKVERKAKESRVRRLSMMLSDIENQNRDLLGGSQLNLVKAQQEAQAAEELKLKEGAQEQARKELQEAMTELEGLEAGAGDVGVQGAAGEGDGGGAVEKGGGKEEEEEEEEEIDINVADPGAEAMLEEMLSNEMLRIFDASPEAIQERIWARRMLRGTDKLRTLEDAVEIEDLDSDKYTMRGFPLSTLRHIAASSMLLKLLLPDELDDLLSTCKVRTFPEGSIVMEQGQSFESNLSETKFWALCEGAADVYVDGNLVAEIVAGQVMGEMSVVRGMERTATVLAGDNVVAVEMTRGDLERALAKRPEVWDELWRMVEERLKAPVFYSSISDDAEERVVANVLSKTASRSGSAKSLFPQPQASALSLISPSGSFSLRRNRPSTIDVREAQREMDAQIGHLKKELEDQGEELHTFEEKAGNVHSEILDKRIGVLDSPIWLRRSDSNLSITSSPSMTSSSSPYASFHRSPESMSPLSRSPLATDRPKSLLTHLESTFEEEAWTPTTQPENLGELFLSPRHPAPSPDTLHRDQPHSISTIQPVSLLPKDRLLRPNFPELNNKRHPHLQRNKSVSPRSKQAQATMRHPCTVGHASKSRGSSRAEAIIRTGFVRPAPCLPPLPRRAPKIPLVLRNWTAKRQPEHPKRQPEHWTAKRQPEHPKRQPEHPKRQPEHWTAKRQPEHPMLAPMMNDQNQIERRGEYQQRGEADGEQGHLGDGNVVYTFIGGLDDVDAGAVATGDAHSSGNAATLHPATEASDDTPGLDLGKNMRRKASEKQASERGSPKGEGGGRMMSTLGSISRSEGRDAAKGLAAAAKDFCGTVTAQQTTEGLARITAGAPLPGTVRIGPNLSRNKTARRHVSTPSGLLLPDSSHQLLPLWKLQGLLDAEAAKASRPLRTSGAGAFRMPQHIKPTHPNFQQHSVHTVWSDQASIQRSLVNTGMASQSRSKSVEPPRGGPKQGNLPSMSSMTPPRHSSLGMRHLS